MKSLTVALLLSLTALTAHAAENRCGYIKKEHLANHNFEISLADAQGTWFIDAAELSDADFNRLFNPRNTITRSAGMVEISCACVTGETSISQTVLRETGETVGPLYDIVKVKSLPLKKCKDDRSLGLPN